MYRAIIVGLILLSGCGGGNPSGTAVTPPIVTPPPPPVVCTFTFSWVNPTQTTGGRDLDVDELIAATLYQFRFPMAEAEEVDAVIDAGDPYTTMWVLRNVQQGTWYYALTVSSAAGESGPSNEVKKAC